MSIKDEELLIQIVRNVLCLRDDANINEMDLTIGFYQIKEIAKQYATSKTKDFQKDLDLAMSEIVKLQMNQITQ